MQPNRMPGDGSQGMPGVPELHGTEPSRIPGDGLGGMPGVPILRAEEFLPDHPSGELAVSAPAEPLAEPTPRFEASPLRSGQRWSEMPTSRRCEDAIAHRLPLGRCPNSFSDRTWRTSTTVPGNRRYRAVYYIVTTCVGPTIEGALRSVIQPPKAYHIPVVLPLFLLPRTPAQTHQATATFIAAFEPGTFHQPTPSSATEINWVSSRRQCGGT